MRIEWIRALSTGLIGYIGVERGRGPAANNVTTFSEELIQPLRDYGFIAGLDIESLKTTDRGRTALLHSI